MHVSIMQFIGEYICPEDLSGKRILEVGSYNVNGSIAPTLKNWGRPSEYVGVDIEEGPGVDVVCSAEHLVEKFGENRFDAVFSIEMMEHVKDWRPIISNMKRVLAPGGILVITTRAKGFKFHAYPHDYWRFELEDIEKIFADCEILVNKPDPQDPGVLVKVRKPQEFTEADLSDIDLYCMLTDQRQNQVNDNDFGNPTHKRIQAKLKRRERRKKRRAIFKKIFG
jgi:SAM-dependent methyltransferase